MIPHRTPAILPWLYPSLMWRMNPHEKNLFLTFDDGPVEGPTEFVLDQLARFSIKATFFCIGDNVRKHPEIFTKMIAHEHTVGNHTVNHLNGWTTDVGKYLANIRGFDALAETAGLPTPTKLFRPPYGRITSRQIRSLESFSIVMWDVLSQDYNHLQSPEKCLRSTIKACRPGSIIVFHDSYKAERNLEYALPRLIDHFGALDFRFQAISPRPEEKR